VYEWLAGKPPAEQLRQPKGQLLGDGSEILSAEGHLYLQDPAGETLQLDAAQGVSEPLGKGAASFLYASSDGQRVFFSDPKQLTSTLGGGVYACHMVEREGAQACELELTTLESAGVFASQALIGSSEDGSYLYYHDGTELDVEQLTAGEGWKPTTIATVSGNDLNDWISELRDRTSRVSPDGRWFAFISQEPLTGYDNHDAANPTRLDEEVFLYDAARRVSEDTPGVTDNPLCASCDPTGARPHGREYHGIETGTHGLVGGFDVWPGSSWIAANVPGWTPYRGDSAVYQSRYLSDNGRLFFNSSDGLVPKDGNEQEDVYEFEPESTGTCSSTASSGSVVYELDSAGCVALISNGESHQESAFLDASEEGSDVFFLTTAKLTKNDSEGGYSVYDAHECPTAGACPTAEAQAPSPCDNESSCKPQPTPQPEVFAPSGSAAFNGPGNLIAPLTLAAATLTKPTSAQARAKQLATALAACKHKYPHRKTKRQACEKAARKAYGAAASAKRASEKGKR
jgi:hypothetical protein